MIDTNFTFCLAAASKLLKIIGQICAIYRE